MGDTEISWATKVWNFTRGCRRTAPKGSTQSGCGDASGGGCYAERQAARFCGEGMAYEGLVKLTANGPRWTGKTKFVAEHLLDPFAWATPQRAFVDSMSDLFYENFTNEEIAAGFGVMAATPQHDYLILTKRIERALEWFSWVVREAASCNAGRGMTPAAYCFAMAQKYDPKIASKRSPLKRGATVEAALGASWPLPNVWMGASVENQAAADQRIPVLLRIPAAIRMISVEPLLGEVDLHRIRVPQEQDERELHFSALQHHHDDNFYEAENTLDWVIVGCESGHRARVCDPRWLRKIRDQVLGAGKALWLKQAEESADDDNLDGTLDTPIECMPEDAEVITPCKRKARRGRDGNAVIERPFLDGKQHLDLPKVVS